MPMSYKKPERKLEWVTFQNEGDETYTVGMPIVEGRGRTFSGEWINRLMGVSYYEETTFDLSETDHKRLAPWLLIEAADAADHEK